MEAQLGRLASPYLRRLKFMNPSIKMKKSESNNARRERIKAKMKETSNTAI